MSDSYKETKRKLENLQNDMEKKDSIRNSYIQNYGKDLIMIVEPEDIENIKQNISENYDDITVIDTQYLVDNYKLTIGDSKRLEKPDY